MISLLQNGEDKGRPSGFEPGERGYISTESNPMIVIGEDKEKLHILLLRGGQYFSIAKDDLDMMSNVIISNKNCPCLMFGLSPKRPKISDADILAILKLRKDRVPWKLIAKEFGFEHGYLQVTVRNNKDRVLKESKGELF